MAGANLDDDDEITGINITPMVDIILVLLVIFMVTTTTIHQLEGMEVDKPDAATGQQIKKETTQMLLVCREDGSVLIDGEPASDDATIVATIKAKVAETPDIQSVISCDESARVGEMVRLIDLLRSNGIKRYAIATEKPKAST